MNELTQAIDLCLPNGTLNPLARGWARKPIVRANIETPWGRRKRWDYWCAINPQYAVAWLLADIDYLGLASVSFLDLRTGEMTQHTEIMGPIHSLKMREKVEQPNGYSGKTIDITTAPNDQGYSFWATGRQAGKKPISFELTAKKRGPGESLVMVVPWSEKRFQLNVKDGCMPVSGKITIGEREITVDEQDTFLVLDWGRGIWPGKINWNWGHAVGRVGERVVAINLGDRWTDGTQMTEDGIILEGQAYKMTQPTKWGYQVDKPETTWRVESQGEGLQLALEPEHTIRLGGTVKNTGVQLVQAWGRVSGEVRIHKDERLEINGFTGFMEDVSLIW